MEAIFAFIFMIISQFFGGTVDDVPSTNDSSKQTTEVAQVVSVVDGDTIKVRIDGIEETVRYIGIDTPEPYRDGEPACYSQEATEQNRAYVADKEIRLVPDEENRDRFDRLLRYVYVDDVFVNQELIEQGFATTLSIRPNTQFASDLTNAQTTARAEGRGLWSACSDNLPQTSEETVGAITVADSQLSDGQQRMLKFLGIDVGTFTVTTKMITCATTAIGTDRLAEITTGALPSIAEGLKLVRCYQS